jgi:hypothetical protein
VLLAAPVAALAQVAASGQAAHGDAGVRVAHVLVALADNRYQGIVPVPAAIGNGDDPMHNLYWGAGYGLRTFLRKSADWEQIGRCGPGRDPVLERCVFRNRHEKVYAVIDAYRGRQIKRAVSDFFAFAAGHTSEDVPVGGAEVVRAAGASDPIARDAVMLARASKSYFADALRWTGAKPLLWTTGLMALEAYVVEATLAGWAHNDTGDQIRRRAALAYDKYQHCGEKAAMHLFATGW